VLDERYASFVEMVRKARPRDVVSFNQVNGVPRGFMAPEPPGYRYVEVWPPNDGWRHPEGLLARSAGQGDRRGDTLAIYSPVWAADRSAALRTVVRTQAVVTTLGANALLYGDAGGVLKHPYYPSYEKLADHERAEVLRWNRFALRVRDLFASGTDTTWYDIGDENGAVSVDWAGATAPEAVAGALFVRVARRDGVVAVSLLDLSGSADGSWTSPTEPGTCETARVTVLVDDPSRWSADLAVLEDTGDGDGRFSPARWEERSHREGRAVEFEVPVAGGWSILRFTRR
jgi:hypothetical protein